MGIHGPLEAPPLSRPGTEPRPAGWHRRRLADHIPPKRQLNPPATVDGKHAGAVGNDIFFPPLIR